MVTFWALVCSQMTLLKKEERELQVLQMRKLPSESGNTAWYVTLECLFTVILNLANRYLLKLLPHFKRCLDLISNNWLQLFNSNNFQNVLTLNRRGFNLRFYLMLRKDFWSGLVEETVFAFELFFCLKFKFCYNNTVFPKKLFSLIVPDNAGNPIKSPVIIFHRFVGEILEEFLRYFGCA